MFKQSFKFNFRKFMKYLSVSNIHIQSKKILKLVLNSFFYRTEKIEFSSHG